jgi:hypothetical protein
MEFGAEQLVALAADDDGGPVVMLNLVASRGDEGRTDEHRLAGLRKHVILPVSETYSKFTNRP